MLKALAGLSVDGTSTPQASARSSSVLAAPARPCRAGDQTQFAGQQDQRRRQRPQQGPGLLHVLHDTQSRNRPEPHTPGAGTHLVQRGIRGPQTQHRTAATLCLGGHGEDLGVRPEADTATTRSIGPTQPGSVGPPIANTGSGEPRPATAASTSPGALEPPAPTTHRLRGRPCPASTDRISADSESRAARIAAPAPAVLASIRSASMRTNSSGSSSRLSSRLTTGP